MAQAQQTELPSPAMNRDELSAEYAKAPYLARKADTVFWRAITSKKRPSCDECWMRQHETGGHCGVRLPAVTTRQIAEVPASALKLCTRHKGLWEELDAAVIQQPVGKKGRR